MLELTLVHHRHGLEPLVRMGFDTPLFVTGGKFVRRSIIEQQEGTQLPTQSVIIKNRVHGETVADPMHRPALMDSMNLFHFLDFRFYTLRFVFHTERIPQKPSLRKYLVEWVSMLCGSAP
jgi:hypothetical protein